MPRPRAPKPPPTPTPIRAVGGDDETQPATPSQMPNLQPFIAEARKVRGQSKIAIGLSFIAIVLATIAIVLNLGN
jgi:hypothetical protein